MAASVARFQGLERIPDVSTDICTVLFIFRRKLLGSFMPHAKYGISKVRYAFIELIGGLNGR